MWNPPYGFWFKLVLNFGRATFCLGFKLCNFSWRPSHIVRGATFCLGFDIAVSIGAMRWCCRGRAWSNVWLFSVKYLQEMGSVGFTKALTYMYTKYCFSTAHILTKSKIENDHKEKKKKQDWSSSFNDIPKLYLYCILQQIVWPWLMIFFMSSKCLPPSTLAVRFLRCSYMIFFM